MTIEQAISKVCIANGLTVEDVRMKSRKSGIIEVRQVATYIAYRHNSTMPKIAERIGIFLGRQRTSTLWSINRVAERIEFEDKRTMNVLINYLNLI